MRIQCKIQSYYEQLIIFWSIYQSSFINSPEESKSNETHMHSEPQNNQEPKDRSKESTPEKKKWSEERGGEDQKKSMDTQPKPK